MLSLDLIEQLKSNIPEYKMSGKINISSLKTALKVAGIKIGDDELTVLTNSLPNNVNELDLKDFENVLIAADSKRYCCNINQRSFYEDKDDLKAYSGKEVVGSIHTVSFAEERGYSDWISRLLKSDVELQDSYIPILFNYDDNDIELYNKCKDGVILCKLINKAVENTIDERAINKGNTLKFVFNKRENLTLAINSASAIGCCVVNIGPGDILDGTKHLLLGLIWQIIRVGLMREINIVYNPHLKTLLLPGEELDDLKKLSPEELLVRWVNYQLAKSDCKMQIKNFKEDVMSGEVYVHLIYQIAPDDVKKSLVKPEEILSIKDSKRRAELVLDNAAILDAKVFITADDIVCANDRGYNRDKLNLAFVANLFNNYPMLTEERLEEIKEEIIFDELFEMNLEERTYINWINSLGVSSPINCFYYSISDGLMFLKVLDKLNPGCVNWKVVVQQFHPVKKLFQDQGNCNEVIAAAKRCSLKVQQISGENIRNRDKVFVLGLTFQLMRYHSIKILQQLKGTGSIDDGDILRWANSRLNNKVVLNSFRDRLLTDSIPILYLIEIIRPNSVDFTLMNNDKINNAKYAITVARKIGATVFILPEHIVSLNQKMIMTLFASLMVLDLKSEL